MTPDKDKYYENATKKLLKTIDEMDLKTTERLRAKNLILLFRDSFKLPSVKYKTFSRELGNDLSALRYDSHGFCRVASIDFAIMMGDIKEWQLMYLDELWIYGPHHFLMHMPSKTILDLTYDQYTNHGLEIPYDIGHKIPVRVANDDAALEFASAVGINDLWAEMKKQKD
jgi:hypothetical protein